MSCCHQVQYKKGCQPRRANHYPNIKCVNLTNIHRFMSSQDSVNRPCFPHKGIITADSAHPKVMILKHAIVSPKKNHNWWHSPPKSFDSKTVLKKNHNWQHWLPKSYDSQKSYSSKKKNHNWLHWLPKSYDSKIFQAKKLWFQKKVIVSKKEP